MTAKPQPMAGQSDAADDLIAELAKLMAQDANGPRPAEVVTPAFSVRIPGGDNASPPGPVPRFDFDRTIAMAAEQPPASGSAPTPTPAKAPEPAAPEPFHFDFDIGAPKREAVAPVATPASPVAATPEPVEPAMAAESTVDHDSIADLIAAELSAEPESAPVSEPAVEPPAPLAAPVAPRPAPQVSTSWAPTTVATNLGGQDQPQRPALRPLNLQPAPRTEQDRFKVPPVFGLGTKPAAAPVEVSHAPTPSPTPTPAPVLHQPAPSVEAPPAPQPQDTGFGRDPIDEIEDLIGRAMRVEFDKPSEPAAPPVDQRPAPSPALRTLATPIAPAAPAPTERPAVAQTTAPRALSGADEAIMAAAQATGAEIGWVEAPEVNDFESTPPVAKRSRRSIGITRAVAGPLVAVTLLLAAGFGLYWVLGLGRETGPAPLLTADTTPIKETPAVQPDAAAAQQSVVFNEIDGVVPGAEEQLVSRDQADVNEVTQVPPTADLSEEGLANRKVRTVTVRPDGTIVSGDDSVAGSAILPVDRPVVPEVPGAETASAELLASAEPAAATPAAAATATATTPATATDTAATPAAVEPAPAATATPVVPGSTVPAVDAAGNPLAGKTAPVPLLRPADLVQSSAPTVTAASPVNAVVDTPAASGGNLLPPPPAASTLGPLPTAQPAAAAAQPEPTPAEPAAAASIPGAVEVEALPNSAPAYAQLASLRTEAEAREAAQRLVSRFGPLFGGANMEVQRVDLGARGIYYRVRVPAESAQAAGSICTNVIAAGGDCVLM